MCYNQTAILESSQVGIINIIFCVTIIYACLSHRMFKMRMIFHEQQINMKSCFKLKNHLKCYKHDEEMRL